MEQAFIKNPEVTVQELVNEVIAKLGENIQVRRFARFKVGEGIEKAAVDFSEEVRAQVAG
jgi:elongation factor Ts